MISPAETPPRLRTPPSPDSPSLYTIAPAEYRGEDEAPPPTREKILALASTSVAASIPTSLLLPVLCTPPFIQSSSLINIRDIGAVPGSRIPEGRIYRCGALGLAAQDPEAVAWLSAHVRTVFDLRRDTERLRGPDPRIPGVDIISYGTHYQYPPPNLERFVENDGQNGWVELLLRVALMYRPAVRAILEHVRDRPKVPFLFHCTAGRDRTGFVAGLLQALAGTADEDIVFDYLLSRIGTEPARDLLIRYAMASVGVDSVDAPGFINFVSLRSENWQAFTDELHGRFGGWDGYVMEGLGFTEEDLAVIKQNLQS